MSNVHKSKRLDPINMCKDTFQCHDDFFFSIDNPECEKNIPTAVE